MTKIRDAIAQLGYAESSDESLCLTRIRGGHVINRTLKECHDKDLAPLGDIYVATGTFRRGSITQDGGRTRANLFRVVDLPFDLDLTDYLGIDKEHLHRSTDGELDGYLADLRDDAGEVLSLVGLSPLTWLSTGYGLLALCRLATDDQRRVDDAVRLHGHLVTRINDVAGFRLADPQVKDAGTRLIRLPGSFNMKGPAPRRVTIYGEPGDDLVHLDDWDIAAAPTKPPRRLIPKHAAALSQEDEEEIVLALNNCWAEGSRHGIALGVGGMLAKANVPEEQAQRIIEACAAGDEEAADRARAVRTSYERVRSGLAVSGFMRLRDLLPHDVMQYIDAKLETVRPQTLGFMDLGRSESGARSERPGFAACPEEAFYGWFNAYRELMQPTTEACDAFHLGTSLVFAGSLVGRRVWTDLGTTLYPNLYLTLVGETGRSRKDTAMNRGQRFFGMSQGAELPFQPYSLLRGVTSGEGLIDYLSDHPHAILYLSELSTMIRRARRQGTLTLMPTLIELWDSPSSVDIPRAGKDSAKSVAFPFLSILAATTPQTLADDMTGADIESGFANRVLWFFGQAGAPISRPPKPDTARSARLYGEFLGALGEYRHGTELHLSTHAAQRWDDWYETSHERTYQSEDEAKMAQRMGANIHRIALIYAASEAAACIDEGHVAAATALVEWSFQCAREQSKRWGWNEESRVAIAIRDALWDGPRTTLSIAKYVGERVAPTMLDRTLSAMLKTGQLDKPSAGLWQLPGGC